MPTARAQSRIVLRFTDKTSNNGSIDDIRFKTGESLGEFFRPPGCLHWASGDEIGWPANSP